jgi:hypothetical protein
MVSGLNNRSVPISGGNESVQLIAAQQLEQQTHIEPALVVQQLTRNVLAFASHKTGNCIG